MGPSLPAVEGALARRRRTARVHRAWLVAAVTFLALLASAAFRSSLGVLLVPIEDDLGWTRTQTSLAVSLNLVVYGVAAPFAAALWLSPRLRLLSPCPSPPPPLAPDRACRRGRSR